MAARRNYCHRCGLPGGTGDVGGEVACRSRLPRTADMGGQGMLEEFLFDGVLVVVPISAQLQLCRPADYADFCA